MLPNKKNKSSTRVLLSF